MEKSRSKQNGSQDLCGGDRGDVDMETSKKKHLGSVIFKTGGVVERKFALSSRARGCMDVQKETRWRVGNQGRC